MVDEASVPRPLLRSHPNTERKVRKKMLSLLPPKLHAAAPKDASLTVLMNWCRQHWSEQTHEAVCAEVLTAFKEAEYIVGKAADDNETEMEDRAAQRSSQHWALSLPTYMHFTSPIRRYADILVHRRLNRILEGEVALASSDPDLSTDRAAEHVDFVAGLKKAVDRCNNKKRDAQDASVDSVQLALSALVRARDGFDVSDAVITRIVLPSTGDSTDSEAAPTTVPKRRGSGKQRATVKKGAIEFYVPVAQCSRSVSFDILGLDIVSSSTEEAVACEPENVEADSGRATHESVVSVVVKPKAGGEEVHLKVLEPLSVRLVSEGADTGPNAKRWTVRFAWASASTTGFAPPPPPLSSPSSPSSGSELPADLATSGGRASPPSLPADLARSGGRSAPPPPPPGEGAPSSSEGGCSSLADADRGPKRWFSSLRLQQKERLDGAICAAAPCSPSSASIQEAATPVLIRCV